MIYLPKKKVHDVYFGDSYDDSAINEALSCTN